MKFDELAEVYTSMSLRSLGFSIIGIFIPVYLYDQGVDIRGIIVFYIFFFVLRIPLAFIVAFIVARIGPKHTIATSIVATILFLLMLLSYGQYGWSLGSLGLMFTISNALFFIALHTDFSKVQHAQHGGKEIGWLFIFERVGAALGPLIGGLVASIFIPEATILIAILVLVASLVPLFLSSEPVKTHQKISFKSFKQRSYMRNFIAIGALNIQVVVSGAFWPLLIAVFIFDDQVYAKLGFIIAVGTVVSLFSARMFGRFIDNKKGASLLNYGAIMNLVLNTTRVFITTGAGAVANNTLGEPVNLSYKMPVVRGFYDEADQNDSQRIVYIVWSEVWVSVAKALTCLIVLAATYIISAESALRLSFLLVGIGGLFMMVQRYPALRRYN